VCFSESKLWKFGGSMRKLYLAIAVALACGLCFAGPALADDIPTSIGAQHFTAGNVVTSAAYAAAVAGQPAPFNAFCGSDISSNCSASWTFLYTIPAGDTITGATLTLGLTDLDSAAPGSQIGSFTLNGTDNLTSLLDVVSEAANAPNSVYEVLSITIPGSDFAELSGGSGTFALMLSGPGLGILGKTNFNGAGLDFSTLDITAMPGGNGGGTTPAPEPPTWALMLVAVAALGAKTVLSKRS
jgi:hypothetical protein